MAHWHYIVDADAQILYESDGYMPDPVHPDPFILMNPPGVQEKAHVSCTVQRSLEYGSVKVSFTLNVSCVQDQRCLEYAAQHAFVTATKFVNNGMQVIAPGLDPLPVPILPA